ncbi:MAG: DUF1508 domain-containing protein [Clostridia bacterium]|nr:DUF1508 domain-containing protein [Clostridia bacterium]
MGGGNVGNTQGSNTSGGIVGAFEFLRPLAEKIGVNLTTMCYIFCGAVVLFIAIIAIIIVAIVKACKKSKRAMAPATEEEIVGNEEKTEEVVATAVVEEKEAEVKPEPKVEEVKPEPKAEPKVEAKAEVKAEVKPAQKQAKKFNGKWIIEHKSENEYMAKLLANNGEVMLSSEIYKSEEGAINGIATIIKGVETGNFVIYQDKNKNFYYKLKTANNRLLCVGEIYKAKDQCLKAVESVKRIAKVCEIDEDVVMGAEYVDYTPAKLTEADIKNSAKGKWKIEAGEDGKYSAKLYANNGQLMLATEGVQIRKNAENAIEAVKKNSFEGNFVIDRDKFGRYHYKLRNAQKSVICIGEAYDSLDSCKSAIESVRKFASSSEVVQ